MTTIMPAQCLACSRLQPTTDPATKTATATRCAAYPEVIPLDIAGGADHRQPRGDERDGLVFDQADTDEARTAFDWWQRVFGQQ